MTAARAAEPPERSRMYVSTASLRNRGPRGAAERLGVGERSPATLIAPLGPVWLLPDPRLLLGAGGVFVAQLAVVGE